MTVQNLVFQSFIWSFGCCVDSPSREKFDAYFRQLLLASSSSSDDKDFVTENPLYRNFIQKNRDYQLPMNIQLEKMYPTEGLVFDFVWKDSSWMSWHTTLASTMSSLNISPTAVFTSILIPTVDTLRHSYVFLSLIYINMCTYWWYIDTSMIHLNGYCWHIYILSLNSFPCIHIIFTSICTYIHLWIYQNPQKWLMKRTVFISYYRYSHEYSYLTLFIPQWHYIWYITNFTTLSNSWMLDILVFRGHHVLCSGDTGTGKSVTIQQKLLHEYTEFSTPILLNFSAQTSANQVQDTVESKLEKRRKNVLGPGLGTKAVVFVDDLNMPAKEEYGAQPPIELLRQMCGQGGWYNRRENVFTQIVDLQLIAAMGPPGGGRSAITSRMIRYFHVLHFVPFDPVVCDLLNIYGRWISISMNIQDYSEISMDEY